MLILIAALAADASPAVERMILCKAYHEQWQWDEHNAKHPVYHDGEWFVPFNNKLRDAAKAEGIAYDALATRNNALVNTMRAGLTAEQNADWKKCQTEFGWKPDADGATYEL